MTAFDALLTAHLEMRKHAREQRRAAKKTTGKLASAFMDAMAYWDGLKAKGGTLDDLTNGLRGVLKEAWPKGECSCPRCRWSCPRCEDTGAIFEQRPARIYGGKLVTVVVPCTCPAGRRFVPASRGSEDFTQAGKTKPTRIGR
jgi:hypothetical protein